MDGPHRDSFQNGVSTAHFQAHATDSVLRHGRIMKLITAYELQQKASCIWNEQQHMAALIQQQDRRPIMKQHRCIALLLLPILAIGCHQGSATAPGTAPANNSGSSNVRKLVVTSPGDQSVRLDQTDEMTITISRSHFTTPVGIELQNLPAGVSVVTTDLTIPADKTSLRVAIKAAPDAKTTEKHKVTIVAKAKEEKDMPDAKVDFELNVKPKS
jgi:hypothetical protein